MHARQLTWHFERGAFGPTDVVIYVPERESADTRFPVLVAFHGRGESAKGGPRGARGWLDDYLLERAMKRLGRPPLVAADFEQWVSGARLEQLNAGLVQRPYGGLIVVCPYLPDLLNGPRAFAEAEELSRFVVEVLLPRVYAKTPALATPASTGVDGVSLGGRAALLVGLMRPLAFGSVAAQQAALDQTELSRFVDLAAGALAQNPALLLRLASSDEDYFRDANRALSAALRDRGVAHDLLLLVGTHGYRFNRGPGALEMLAFHDRVLRGAPAP